MSNETIKVLDSIVNELGIDDKEDVSIEDIFDIARYRITDAESAYYKGEEARCEDTINKAIRVLELSKTWNKHFGF